MHSMCKANDKKKVGHVQCFGLHHFYWPFKLCSVNTYAGDSTVWWFHASLVQYICITIHARSTSPPSSRVIH